MAVMSFTGKSMSVPQVFDMKINHENPRIVKRIEKHAQNNIQLTLEGVLDFMDKHKGDLTTQYKVFKNLLWFVGQG